MAVAATAEGKGGDRFLGLDKLRTQFQDYLSSKQGEIRERREAQLYYHGSQWTKGQLAELKTRGQPPVTTPKFARKINGFVGLLERLRQDPKAYPRTTKEQEGADLCTAALRYALDEQQWDAKSPVVTMNGAVDAIGGMEVGLEPGDSGVEGDYDVTLEVVDPNTYFYDPRSFKHDFSDARFDGISKWADLDAVEEMFPDKADEIKEMAGKGVEFSMESDAELKWVATNGKQLRLVEHWYRRGKDWYWATYCGDVLFDQGRSYLKDEKGRDERRFVMWRSFVDQDGDSYSFHRLMKSMVDEINQRRSKAMHLLAMRRVKLEEGAVQDIEVLRREMVKPDGVIVHAPGMELDFEDAKNLADMRAQLEMLQHAESELENFGPNPALVGQGVEAKSGKAIQLLQQAGIAELGPYIIGYRGWKIRLYRTVYNAIKRYWTAPRWIRVTDQDGQEQPVSINSPVDPETGQPGVGHNGGPPMLFNQIGVLDVDIRIDEGPDTLTMMADTLETLLTAMRNGTQIPAEAIFELLDIPDTMRKKLIGISQQAQQPNPVQVQGAQIELAQGAAKVRETDASAALKLSQAHQARQPEPMQPGPPGPTQIELIETAANAEHARARTDLAYAQADKLRMDTALAPQELAAKAANERRRADAMTDRAASRLT